MAKALILVWGVVATLVMASHGNMASIALPLAQVLHLKGHTTLSLEAGQTTDVKLLTVRILTTHNRQSIRRGKQAIR